MKKVLMAVAALAGSAAPALADGGTSPYASPYSHIRLDAPTAASGVEFVLIGAIVLVIIGTAIVSYVRKLEKRV